MIKQNPKCAALIEEKFSKERSYKSEGLGSYLDNKLFRGTELKKYSAESGTIRNELVFCQNAVEFMTDYDMLTDEAKALIEKLVAFIESNN